MTEETRDYNLHGLASSIVRDSQSADPHDLGIELINSIDPAHFDEAVQAMAREYIRSIIGSLRAQANKPSTAQGSRKVEAARNQWRRLIEIPEFVPSLNAWVKLHEATYDQVMEMAAYRMAQAHRNAAAAKRFEKIAKSMKALNAAVVGDLPDDLLEDSFSAKVAA
jgi:hypothetical protein